MDCKYKFIFFVFALSSLLAIQNASAYIVDYHVEIERKDTNYAPVVSSLQTGNPVIFYSFPKVENQTANAPWILRNQYFLKKYIKGFSQKAIIVDFSKRVELAEDDYMSLISNEVAESHLAIFIPSQISDIDSLYRTNFASMGISFDNYWDMFYETKMTLEEFLGVTDFDYRKDIKKNSAFSQYDNAVKYNKKVIFIHYEAFHLPSLDAQVIIKKFRDVVGEQAYILPIKTIKGYYNDPAVEALSNCGDSFLCIYNPQNNKAHQVFDNSKDITKEFFEELVSKVK